MAEKNIKQLQVEEFEEISGHGIIGKIQENNFIIGNRKILEKYGITNLNTEKTANNKANYQEDEKRLAQKGNSIVYVVKNKEIIALIGVNDIIRENAVEVLKMRGENI